VLEAGQSPYLRMPGRRVSALPLPTDTPLPPSAPACFHSGAATTRHSKDHT